MLEFDNAEAGRGGRAEVCYTEPSAPESRVQLTSTALGGAMRVLVTGHLGYIGTILAPVLAAAGHEVVGLDSDLYRKCTFGSPEAIAPLPTLERDIRDLTIDDLAGFDAVAHLAALSNDPLGDLDPELTLEINHRASVRLASLARDAGVRRFVFSSSCSSYGAADDDRLLTEDGELQPVTIYGRSKVLTESDLNGLASDDFSPTSLRNATAYGMSPRHRFDVVLNNLVAWAVTTGRVHLKSDGSPWRPLVHVEDISRAFLAVLEAPRELVHAQAFNVGSSAENYRVRELAEIVAETVPGTSLEFAAGASPDKRNYRVNCDRITAVLGYRTRWTVRQGAAELYEGYRDAGLTLADFEGPRYQRIAHIRSLLADGELDSSLRRRASVVRSA